MPALGLASYCYLKNLFELESKFQDLKNYVFSNTQTAEHIERHQQ